MYLVGYNENNPSELLFKEVSPDDEDIEKQAEEAGMTHWSLDEDDYGSYFLVYYNVGEKPYVEGFSYDYGYEQTREYAPRRSKDHVFVIDEDGKVESLTLPRWERKDNVSSKEEALQYLASYLSSKTGITEDMVKEAEEFAAKWEIPFSGELHNLYVKNWTDCHPAWNSSSAYC